MECKSDSKILIELVSIKTEPEVDISNFIYPALSESFNSATIKEEHSWNTGLDLLNSNDEIGTDHQESHTKGKQSKKPISKCSNKKTKVPKPRKDKGEMAEERLKNSHFTCDICYKRFKNNSKNSHLRTHQQRVRNEESTTCQICRKVFARPRNLVIHQAHYHGMTNELWAKKNYEQWPHRCDKCSFHFRVKELIWYHKCEYSDSATATEKHESIESYQSDLDFECKKCKMRFKQRHLLVKHDTRCLEKEQLDDGNEKSNQTTKGEQCTECSKTFRLKSKLENHIMRVHSQDRKFSCTKCDKKFYEKRRSLEDHFAAKHLGKARYECEYCGKQCFSYYEYINHRKRAHAKKLAAFVAKNGGKQPPINELFSMDGCSVISTTCEICGRKFFNGAKLESHLRTVHLRERKQFSCNQCDQAFGDKRYLEDHYSKLHIGRPRYECEFCGLLFFYQAQYSRHRKIKHPEEYSKLVFSNGVRHVPSNELYSMDGCVVVTSKTVVE
ncbi:zinc finger protein 667-like [Uranotaenia lowii]|uniref:zinc finger protein 667-like n=1 Tax=Uranotaenia lowii TaxID=190385 RepID=UPI002478CD10|nr:zinc finger protein 667-like [Uranotaenia lowii]XP_055610803.1 zinc finger protein 667-like [Uranotaenia lowii]